jgi:hypothetical protein
MVGRVPWSARETSQISGDGKGDAKHQNTKEHTHTHPTKREYRENIENIKKPTT